MDDIFDEKDMFATFCTEYVYEPMKDIYITNDEALADENKGIYYAEFRISEAMRAYIGKTANAYEPLKKLLDDSSGDIWKKQSSIEVKNQSTTSAGNANFNFFKLIRKEKDELSFSNALAYFIEQIGINDFLQHCLYLNAKDSYALLREKNNIDISFLGNENVVIIENKIDSNITVDKRKSVVSQIKDAVELYFVDHKGSDKAAIEKKIVDLIQKEENQQASQLSKYYLYAVAYLLSKGINWDELEKHIKCFLLIPEYAKNQFPQDSNQCYDSDFMYSKKYKVITYKDMYKYFEKKTGDNYLDDFKSALIPLAHEFNNEIEEDCKYRFFKAIGKI